MLRLLQMGPSKVLTIFLIPIHSSWQLSLLELPPCRITMTPSSDSSDMYTSTVQSSPASANDALSPHPRLQTSYPPFAHSISSPSAPPPPSLAPGFSSAPPASTPPPDSLRVLQWNAGGLRARSTELLRFLSSHPVDLICIPLLIPRTLAVSERRKAFAAAHRSDEDRQAYISASRSASSVIAKAKAEAWQTTCSSLSPKSNPKSVHSLLRSIAGSSSSSSSSPNFPNCSSPRESVSVYAAYLRSHFSISQPKALRSRARGYFLSSAKPRALWSLTCSFALLSLSLHILRLPPTFPRPSPLAQIKLPIPC